jgi:hypothetical protein
MELTPCEAVSQCGSHVVRSTSQTTTMRRMQANGGYRAPGRPAACCCAGAPAYTPKAKAQSPAPPPARPPAPPPHTHTHPHHDSPSPATQAPPAPSPVPVQLPALPVSPVPRPRPPPPPSLPPRAGAYLPPPPSTFHGMHLLAQRPQRRCFFSGLAPAPAHLSAICSCALGCVL